VRRSPRSVAIVAGQLVLGGAERQLHLWLSHLDRERFRPVVLTLHPGAGDYWEESIERLGIPLLRVPRARNRLARLFAVARALKPHRPELIHGWHLFASPYAGAAGKLLGARASLGSLRGSFDAYRRQRAEAVLTECLVDGILVNSRSAGDRLAASHGARRKRIYTLPNAVEERVEERSRARADWSARWGIPEDRFWIGSVGRLDRGKRFDHLFEVAALLARSGRNVHAVLVGEGPAREELRQRARALGIADRATLAGADPSVRESIGALDLFCFPSPDEGLPNAVMEAAAAAVPILAWRRPFLEELLDAGESAALAPYGDLSGWRREAEELMEDPDRRRRMGEAGRRKVVERFSVGRFVAGLTAAYEDLLGAAAS
jgi:glycosyltransferase involved in cell wall biosynthesis